MKKFIIIGSQNAITYKEVFPFIKNNELWLGMNYVKEFRQPNGEIKKFGNICWFTNLDHAKRNKPLDLYKHYSNEYKHYDNYCAIEVGKVKDIPVDDYVDIEIPDEEYNKWKQCYGDDIEIIEK